MKPMRSPRRRTRCLLAAAALIVPVGCQRAAPVTDASLTAAVQNRLSADGAIASEPIQATVQNAVVTLNGNVSSDAARSLASNDAAQVSGVRTVINNLSVQSAQAMQQPIAPVAPPVFVPPSSTSPATSSTAQDRRARREQERRDREARQAANAAATRGAVPSPSVPAAPPPVAAAVAPPAPVVRSITVPAGTILSVRLSQTLDSASTQQGQGFSGALATDVTVDGVTVLRQGSNVAGQVTAVQEAGHFRGNSLLTISLNSIARRGDRIPIETDSYSAQGKGRGVNTAEKVGGGAAVGAILGGIFGGGKGAAIGAAAGGGTGAGVNGLTRGQQVQIPAESVVRFRLSSPVTVRVSGDPDAAQAYPESGRRPLQ